MTHHRRGAASQGLSVVIKRTDGRAVVAFGPAEHHYDSTNSDDVEGDARAKLKELREKKAHAK